MRSERDLQGVVRMAGYDCLRIVMNRTQRINSTVIGYASCMARQRLSMFIQEPIDESVPVKPHCRIHNTSTLSKIFSQKCPFFS